jgi:glycyl-tRNA synthetase beta chain
VECFATPCRIVVLIHQVAEKQQDVNEIKGPPKIAVMTRSVGKQQLVFAKSGFEPDQLLLKISGVEYVYATKKRGGCNFSLL